MTEIKIQHILTLAYLLSRGARYNFIFITTTELGQAITKSQQAASKHLTDLEQDGFIERTSRGRSYLVKITDSGYEEIIKLQKVLDSSMRHTSTVSDIVVHGKLVSGVGEGAYYMSLKGYTKQFKSNIGYIPFPGTLNIKLEKKEYQKAVQQFDILDGTKINGFSDGKRTYGWVKCFAGKINNSVDCQLVRLERTHHDPTIIELISKHNLRRTAKLSDNSTIKITISV